MLNLVNKASDVYSFNPTAGEGGGGHNKDEVKSVSGQVMCELIVVFVVLSDQKFFYYSGTP